jgi:hypothetical protein
MWQTISDISTLHWVLGIITIIVIPILVFAWKYLILQIRFANNLRRKIYFLKLSDEKPLITERNLLSNTKLFNVEKEIYTISNDPKILQLMDKHSLFVIGYDPNYGKYEELINKAKSTNTPIVLFAKQGEIKESTHWELFNGYIYCDIANTSSRLTVIILNTMYIV